MIILGTTCVICHRLFPDAADFETTRQLMFHLLRKHRFLLLEESKLNRDMRWSRSTVCQACNIELGKGSNTTYEQGVPIGLAAHVYATHGGDWFAADGPRTLLITEEPS